MELDASPIYTKELHGSKCHMNILQYHEDKYRPDLNNYVNC